jgi:hypothetical protein
VGSITRHALLLTVSLTALSLGLSGCQGTGSILVNEKPRAQATLSPGFNPQAHDKIAVLVRNRTDLYYREEEGIKRQVEDVFEQAAARRGYRLATRSQVRAIKEEIEFQKDSYWTERNPAEPGHLYSVSALLIVSINESYVEEKNSPTSKVPESERDGFLSKLLNSFLDNSPDEVHHSTASVSADLVSVREGEVLWNGYYTGSVEVEEDEPEGQAIPTVSEVVASALPAK